MKREDGDRLDVLAETAEATPESRPAARDPIAVATLASGTHVGRYVIDALLGRGGMGSVYRARDPELGRYVAVKLLHSDHAESQARLRREGQAVAKLRHNNVVTIYDVGTHSDGLFIAMELIHGVTLGAWLREKPRTRREIVDVFAAAGHGLAAAHAVGLVHRDFKPDNVLIEDRGRVVVTDFGLAREEAGAEETWAGGVSVGVTQTGALLGTPAYMSPEQLQGKPVDARSDQFSFAVALYEALAGTRPFAPQATTFDELRRGVLEGMHHASEIAAPAVVRRVLARGLALDPKERFASMDKLLVGLGQHSRARRAWIFVPALAIAVGAVLFAQRDAGDPCETVAAQIDFAWTPFTRQAARLKLGEGAQLDEDLASLDRFATRWRALRADACHRASSEAGRELATQQATCLDSALAELDRAIASYDHRGWLGARTEIGVPSIERCAGPHPTETISTTNLPHRISSDIYGVLAFDKTRLALLDGSRLEVYSLTGSELASHDLSDQPHLLEWPAEGIAVLTNNELTYLDPVTGHRSSAVAAPGLLAVSPDRRTALSWSDDGIRIVSLADGSRSDVLARIVVANVHWSPDGRWVLVIDSDRLRLWLVDVAARRATIIEDRLSHDLTGTSSARWVDAQRFVTTGRANHAQGQGVWSIRISSTGAPIEAPELRLPVDPSVSYEVLDAPNGRALAARTTITRDFTHLRDGKPTPIAAIRADFVDSISPDGHFMLIRQNEEIELVGDNNAIVVLPNHDASMALDRDRIVAVSPLHPQIVAFDYNGRPSHVADLPPIQQHSVGAHVVLCASGSCVLVRLRKTGFDYFVLRDAHLDPATHIDATNPSSFALTPDGATLMVLAANQILEIPLASHRIVRSHTLPTDPQQCTPQSLAVGKDVYITSLCPPGRSRIYRLSSEGAPQLFHDSEAWIGNVVVGPNDDLYFAKRLFRAELQLIDGM